MGHGNEISTEGGFLVLQEKNSMKIDPFIPHTDRDAGITLQILHLLSAAWGIHDAHGMRNEMEANKREKRRTLLSGQQTGDERRKCMIKETTIPEGEASSRRDQGKASQRNRKSLSRCDQAPARILGKNSRKSGDGHGEVPMRGRHYEPDAAATRDGSVLAQLGGVRHRDWCRDRKSVV